MKKKTNNGFDYRQNTEGFAQHFLGFSKSETVFVKIDLPVSVGSYLHIGLSCEISSSLVHSFLSPHSEMLDAMTSLLSSG